MTKKKISVTTSCLNEAQNLPELYARVKAVFAKRPQYDWELIVADNKSTDGSRDVLRNLAGRTSASKLFSTPAISGISARR